MEHVIYVNWLLILTLDHIELYHKYSLLNEFVVSLFNWYEPKKRPNELYHIVIVLLVSGHCVKSLSDFSYKGDQNVAQDNKQCKPWTEVLKVFDPSDFPDATVADAGSSCRNPEFKPMGPYCYTSATDWEYCDIPLCAGKLHNQKRHKTQ